jgi:iron complex transport system permease protein
MNEKRIIGYGIVPAIVILFLCNLFCGSVSIPIPSVLDIVLGRSVDPAVWGDIVLRSRLPQAITALLGGAALAVSGLMLQTLFRNPLAGPSILGISSGANLGVAIVMMWGGAAAGINLGVVGAAFIGALAVLGLILYFSARVKNNVLVLIIGMMIGYLASSGISILHSLASSENIRSYVLWGLGSFSSVSYSQVSFYGIAVTVGLMGAILLIKPLNILLLGENYAANLGVRIKRTRVFILLVTGFLTAVVTAFCGPVSFIGLAVPHIARLVLRTSRQQFLLPATLLSGAATALLCNLLTVIPIGKSLLPLNAVTPLLGAPVILYVILNRKNLSHFG